MYLLFIYFPIGAFSTGCTLGRSLGSRGIAVMTITSPFISLIISSFIIFEIVCCSATCHLTMSSWFRFGELEVNWGLLSDSLPVITIWVVRIISPIVQIYSVVYMGGDPHLGRFMSKSTLSTIFMFIPILSDNFVQFLFGWEGVGISSHPLTNFRYGRIAANRSAFQAIIMNRIGDFGLMLGIISIHIIFKTLDFEIILNFSHLFCDYFINVFGYQINLLHMGLFSLLPGAIGKSAQIGLHVWLPSATEGPTPVPAPTHSSTMVVAGIYLIIRCSKLFEIYPVIMIFTSFIGASTVSSSSLSGITQYDIKKIIAYSTCSQLGYMLFARGAHSFAGGFYHLVTHASFKSSPSSCAGCVVHSLSGEQDIRFMGGSRTRMPIVPVIMLVGIPTPNGFFFSPSLYSKEILLLSAFQSNNPYTFSMFLLITFCSSSTSFYSFRLLYHVFFGSPQTRFVLSAKETDWVSFSRLLVPPILSITIGSITEDILIGPGTGVWQNAISTSSVGQLEAESVPSIFQFIPLTMLFWGFYLFYRHEIYSKSFAFIKTFGVELKSFGWDGLHKSPAHWSVLFHSYNIFSKPLDKGLFEYGEYSLILRSLNGSKLGENSNDLLLSINKLLLCPFLGFFVTSSSCIAILSYGTFIFNPCIFTIILIIGVGNYKQVSVRIISRFII